MASDLRGAIRAGFVRTLSPDRHAYHFVEYGLLQGTAPGMTKSHLPLGTPVQEEKGRAPNRSTAPQLLSSLGLPGRRANRVPLARLLFILVFLVCAIYMATDLKRSWAPEDEGTLGQSAERVLQGELPQRDFDDVYTGGLS